MHDPIAKIRTEVQAFAIVRGNKRRLAREAGIPESTLGGLQGEDWNPTVQTLTALHTAMLRLKLCDSKAPRRGRHPLCSVA